MNRELIIYGAGYRGENLLKEYGSESVFCFCDCEKRGKYLGKDIISLDEFIEMYDPDRFLVLIAIDNVNAAYEVMMRLKLNNISVYKWVGISPFVMHVYSADGVLYFEYDETSIVAWRAKQTAMMIKDTMFNNYSDCRSMDFYVYIQDDVFEASRICELLQRSSIFAYSSIYGLDNVIPIPDYKFSCDFITDSGYYGDFIKSMENISIYTDHRAFWAGNVDNDKMRRVLVNMGKKYNDKLFIYGFVFRNGVIDKQMIDPKDFVNFKYLIDIRGWGWTDRVKYLLGMKRPLLLVDRPYREYYFDLLKPMVHYVPVKEDLSDLMEKIQILEDTPGLYDEIVNNAFEFCKNNFSKDRIRKELYNRICKYGVSVNN